MKIDGAALRVLSFLTDSNQRRLATLASEKRKVTVIGEEHEPEELVCGLKNCFFFSLVL